MPVLMMAIGLFSGFFKFIQIALLENFSDSISFKIKKEYFKAVLFKDASWFDLHNPNEMAGKISQETDMI